MVDVGVCCRHESGGVSSKRVILCLCGGQHQCQFGVQTYNFTIITEMVVIYLKHVTQYINYTEVLFTERRGFFTTKTFQYLEKGRALANFCNFPKCFMGNGLKRMKTNRNREICHESRVKRLVENSGDLLGYNRPVTSWKMGSATAILKNLRTLTVQCISEANREMEKNYLNKSYRKFCFLLLYRKQFCHQSYGSDIFGERFLLRLYLPLSVFPKKIGFRFVRH